VLLVTTAEQAARDRQTSRESRMEPIENLTDQQISAELQQSQTAREQAARDLTVANDITTATDSENDWELHDCNDWNILD